VTTYVIKNKSTGTHHRSINDGTCSCDIPTTTDRWYLHANSVRRRRSLARWQISSATTDDARTHARWIAREKYIVNAPITRHSPPTLDFCSLLLCMCSVRPLSAAADTIRLSRRKAATTRLEWVSVRLHVIVPYKHRPLPGCPAPATTRLHHLDGHGHSATATATVAESARRERARSTSSSSVRPLLRVHHAAKTLFTA